MEVSNFLENLSIFFLGVEGIEILYYAFVFLVVTGVIFWVMTILYILGCIGLMIIAEKTETKRPWMAWLPIFNVYLIGKIAFNNFVGWIMAILVF